MVTELVANAIDHTDAPAIDLTVVAEGPTLRVEVANDRGPEEPVLASAWAESGARGRGLRIVAALSAELRLHRATADISVVFRGMHPDSAHWSNHLRMPTGLRVALRHVGLGVEVAAVRVRLGLW